MLAESLHLVYGTVRGTDRIHDFLATTCNMLCRSIWLCRKNSLLCEMPLYQLLAINCNRCDLFWDVWLFSIYATELFCVLTDIMESRITFWVKLFNKIYAYAQQSNSEADADFPVTLNNASDYWAEVRVGFHGLLVHCIVKYDPGAGFTDNVLRYYHMIYAMTKVMMC